MFVGTNRPVAKNITDEGWKLLELIKASGAEGCTRRDLTEGTGKFNNWSRAQLEILQSSGYITIEERRMTGSPMIQHVYHATSTE